MFRRSVLLFLVSVVVVSATAEAQQGPRRRRGFGRVVPGGLNYLMAVSEVREHLAITDEQEELFGGLILDWRAQLFAGMRRRRPGGPGRGEEGRRRRGQLIQQFDELLAILLEPEQIKRLRELRLQYDGVSALDKPDFAKSLELSEEQQEQIKAIRGDQPGQRANAQQEAQILATLTDEQKDTWNRMKGEVFVFPESLAELERQRGRRGGRRSRPQRP